jgi:hypothetical protein
LRTPLGPSPPPAEWKTTIQKIIQISGGIKAYLACEADPPVPPDAALCPFCAKPHRLRRHGFYTRTVVDGDAVWDILIRRLLCATTGHTVSLLPDFLVPRKRHSLLVIATFLYAFAWTGVTLLTAVRQATRSYVSYQKGAFWCRAIRDRSAKIQQYASTLAERGPTVADIAPPLDTPSRRTLRILLQPLLDGHDNLVSALVHHSTCMHGRCGCSVV